jgi:chromosomal replication initiator protein
MFTSYEQLWNETLNDLQTKMNKQSFNSWLKETKATAFNSGNLTVIVPDDIAKEHIEKTYPDLIAESLMKISGEQINCSFTTGIENNNNAQSVNNTQTTINTPANNSSQSNQQTPEPYSYGLKGLGFNPNYTFDTFVIGPNNELAHAAAESISKNPAGQYNPLFIYGESGLGKTHLLQAIGNAITSEKPFLKVLYVTSEQFVSEFIQAIQTNSIQNLKIKYRNVDVLMIDDIQFLANKEQTQTEFFHTFNELHVNKKQIIMTSDRPPRELSLLTDRLRTRFEGGLLADVKAPSLETREAILRTKAEMIDLDIDDEIISYLAKRIKSNIRLLESALNKLHAISTIKKMDITIDIAKQYLKPLFEEQKDKEIGIDDILNKVAEKFNVSVDNIKSKSRHSSIIQPRFISMFLATRLTHLTTTEIGKEIGKRDHSTVINARNNIEKAVAEDDNLKENIDDIIADLKS